MKNIELKRIDADEETTAKLLPFCSLKLGDIWIDPVFGHKIACIDSTDSAQVKKMMNGEKAKLAIHDPPYNFIAFDIQRLDKFIQWCKHWIKNTAESLDDAGSAFYIWLGADQKNDFQPLPDFMIMMRNFMEFKSRSFITMRNQRGYGTQKNWMSVRQECLYYIKGEPFFKVQYTDIPKILKGYYKKIDGDLVDNFSRSKSKNIRPSNVWVDIQQVFYRMIENVNGCYAQKPLKSIERIMISSSQENDITIDFFGHSGTTLIAAEMLKRKCFIADNNPIYCEIMIKRLNNFRKYGQTGWQNSSPFENELQE